MVEDQPPGFRFYPTEEELVTFYLHNKLAAGQTQRQDLIRLMDRIIPVVCIYDYNPWDLPQFSQHLCHRDSEQWFFFIPSQEREARGGRPNRLTTEGYWKSIGSPGFVYSSNNNRQVAVKRTMVFYKGRAPNGTRTEWKMNEYKAIDIGEASTSSTSGATPMVRLEFSLSRVYKKSKCIRSFDRRPQPGVIIHEPNVTLPQLTHHNGAIMSFDHQNIQTGSAPYQSTSSGNHDGRLPQIGESSNSNSTTVITSNDEPCLDWDQLYDWLFN